MEGHREAMRLIAYPLDEEERGAFGRERDRLVAIAGEQQFFFLRNADGDQVPQAEFLEGRIRRRQLPLAAVDEDKVGERAAGFKEFPISAQHNFVHGGEVVIYCDKAGMRDPGCGIRGVQFACTIARVDFIPVVE